MTLRLKTYFSVFVRTVLDWFRIAPLSANTLIDEDLRHRDMARHPDARVTCQRIAK